MGIGRIAIGLLVVGVALGEAQTPPCPVTLSRTSIAINATNGQLFQGNFNVMAAGTCRWTSVANDAWIAIQVGPTGIGNGIVGYSANNNRTAVARVGTITVNNAVFTISQAANACPTTLTPVGNPNVGAEGGTLQLRVETTCEWTAVANADWVTFGSPNGTTGNGTVQIFVAANPTNRARTAVVQASGQSLTINQAAGTCVFTVTPANISIGAAGGNSSFALATGCDWTAATTAAWIRLAAPVSGTGNATVNFSVDSNATSADARTGQIQVGTSVVNVTQAAGNCTAALTPASVSVAAEGANGTVQVSTPCTFTATPSAAWIQVTAVTANSVSYTVATNVASLARTGTITIAGQTFTITQAGTTCRYTVTPESIDVDRAGGSGSVNVTLSAAGCQWNSVSDVAWVRVTGTIAGTLTGSTQYVVDPNPGSESRQGTLTVAGRAIAVRQAAGQAPRLTAAGIVNAASFVGGPVAPGEIVTLFGSGLGPADLRTLELTGDGLGITSTLGGVRILFDNVAAPLIYVSAAQVAAIVPYGVAGRGTTNVQAEFGGVRSAAVPVRVVSAGPALFSIDSSGRGAGAILNQNGTVNSTANPARRGEVIVLFGTGEGLTEPVPGDGRLTPGQEPLPRPRLPVQVTIGGQAARVLYAGGAPGLVAGVVQINVQLTGETPVGDSVPVQVTVGEASSPDTVTVAIR